MKAQDGWFSCRLRSMHCSIWNETQWYERWRVWSVGESGDKSYQAVFGQFVLG